MTLQETLSQLKALRNESTYAHNLKNGVGESQYGVKMGDIRVLAKKIKVNQSLAIELWETGNMDAQLLAVLIMDLKKLSSADIEQLLKSTKFTQAADWFYSYVIKIYEDKESLRGKWMQSENVMLARAGWSLTSGCIARNPELVDIQAILDRLESEMATAAPEIQWTMNSALANIGINHPKYRDRALAIGEKLGIYRDYPVSKGCTSPFAPIWINEMVSRQA